MNGAKCERVSPVAKCGKEHGHVWCTELRLLQSITTIC